MFPNRRDYFLVIMGFFALVEILSLFLASCFVFFGSTLLDLVALLFAFKTSASEISRFFVKGWLLVVSLRCFFGSSEDLILAWIWLSRIIYWCWNLCCDSIDWSVDLLCYDQFFLNLGGTLPRMNAPTHSCVFFAKSMYCE